MYATKFVLFLLLLVTALPLDVAAAWPFDGMKKPVTLGGTKASSLPQARGQVPPGGPNPCTNIPRRGDGHCK